MHNGDITLYGSPVVTSKMDIVTRLVARHKAVMHFIVTVFGGKMNILSSLSVADHLGERKS